jgi:hypothetical protein
VTLTRWSPQAGRRKTNVARAYLSVTTYVVVAAVLALLLLANSVVDYRYVSRLLTVQQVRRDLDEQMVALERRLRANEPVASSLAELLTPAPQGRTPTPLWVEIRRPDGSVVVRQGMPGPRLFTSDDQSAHFRDREPLFKVIPVGGGEAVVEVFPLYATGIAAVAPPAAAPQGPRRSLVAVEIAAPLEVRDPSVIWRVRRNLFINSSGALALLATAVAAGFGFRTYIRGRRLEDQLEIAREVQTELLPAGTESWTEVGLSTIYQPADQVGGDFYDGFRAAAGRIALVMGDVSGKGVPAALVTGVIHGAVRSSTWANSAADHERESARLNQLLCERSSGARFASMFWSYYDPATRRLCYVNAGHCPGLLAGTRDGRVEVTALPATGTVMGLLPAATYEQATCDVCPGDVLVLYSDGVVEAVNSADEEYGEGRLREALTAAGGEPPERIRDGILASVSAFVGTMSLRDDLTLVVAKLS